MHYLSDEHILSISARLKEADISYSHLYDDLLDHLCCDIEECMQQGLDFQSSYSKVFEKIGLSELKDIQEATIFYVQLNLSIMKKLMNGLAIVGTSVLAIGFIFKLSHWPGGSMVFALGFLLLFLGFFPVALLSLRRELKASLFSREFLVYLIGFIVLTETGLAVLFKAMHWPGGNYLVIVSWILFIFVFFPMIFYKIIKSEKNKVPNLALSIFSFLFIGASIVFGYNKQTDVFNIIELKSIDSEIEYYVKDLENPRLSLNAENYSEKLDQIITLESHLHRIDAIITNYQKVILNGENDLTGVIKNYMHSSDMSPDYDNGLASLRTELNEYSKLSLKLCDRDPILEKLILSKLNTGTVDYGILGKGGWLKRIFSRGGDVKVFTNLQKTKKEVYQIHYEIVRDLRYKQKAPEL